MLWWPWHSLPMISSPLHNEHGVDGLRLEKANPTLQAGCSTFASSLIERLEALDAPSKPRHEGGWR